MLLRILFFATLAAAQSNWPAQLATDVETRSWDAAARVGAALIEEIQAGRIFARVTDVPEEVKARNLYADALEHTGQSQAAARQRTLARLLAENPDAPEVAAETARRVANLKSGVLSLQMHEPSHFQKAGKPQVIVFWADWCALCKPELDRLSRYQNPRAKIVTLDADHLDPNLRDYLRLESLLSPELPQLYIVDSAGNIRFHLTGFEDDGFFEKKLDWMIEAALQPGPRN